MGRNLYHGFSSAGPLVSGSPAHASTSHRALLDAMHPQPLNTPLTKPRCVRQNPCPAHEFLGKLLSRTRPGPCRFVFARAADQQSPATTRSSVSMSAFLGPRSRGGGGAHHLPTCFPSLRRPSPVPSIGSLRLPPAPVAQWILIVIGGVGI